MGTIRQKRAISNLMENGGNVTRAMIDAGYSPATANNPKNLTESDTFKSIAEQIPDDLLVKVHTEGLSATSVRFTPEGEKIKVADYATRHKYMESGYKLKKVIDGDGPKLALMIAFDPTFNAPAQKATRGSK